MRLTVFPKVKICGITRMEDAQYATEEGADALGFIFYPDSPRYITPAAAGRIIRSLPAHVMTVGVFVNTPRKQISNIVSETDLQAIQLSGDESPSDCLGFDIPVIKAFRFQTMSDLDLAGDYSVSGILLDGHRAGAYGGTGMAVDKSIGRAAARRYPLILAGGLTPGNIVESVREIDPIAVDVNSGVEKAPGRKDFQKISLLFRNLRKLNLEI